MESRSGRITSAKTMLSKELAQKPTDEEAHGKMNPIRGDGMASKGNDRVNHRERNKENGRQVRVEGGVPSVS